MSSFWNYGFGLEAQRTRNAPPLFVIVLVLTLAGCSAVGPDYVKPDIPAPVEWSRELRGGLTRAQPEPETLAQWWTTLGDPDLSNLIQRALAGNRDLKKARRARVAASPRPICSLP